MKAIKKKIIPVMLILGLGIAGCDKLPLQKNDKYEQSFYDNKINSSVLVFMESRPDLFSGMLSAISYVEKSPDFKDIRKMYLESGNTYLLLTNNATSNIESLNSYFTKNLVQDTDPTSPTYNLSVKGSDWTQYRVEQIAAWLKYHVLKGTHDYKTLNSIGKWVDTYGISQTNDSAKVWIYLQASRDGFLFVNNYVGGTGENRPRTPDLHATNGVVQVMDTYFTTPTRRDILNNK